MPKLRGFKEVLLSGAFGTGFYDQRFARLKHCQEKLPDKSSSCECRWVRMGYVYMSLYTEVVFREDSLTASLYNTIT
tara:strand:- start:253 stop:483 length:231 start_codon:yes stop_codon:yes gene_type:complete